MKKITMSLLTLFVLLMTVAVAFAGDINDPVKMKEYFTIATSVVGTFSVIANFTKSNSDNVVVAGLAKLVNLLSANWFVFIRPRRG